MGEDAFLGRFCNGRRPSVQGMQAPIPVPPLSFSLRVWPASTGSAWRAEMCDRDGVRTAFTTPLELLRFLADLGGQEADSGGLR